MVSVEEYLQTTYEPDAEYIDGRIVKRSVPQFDHGRLQLQLGAYFYAHEKEWNVIGVTETRVQVRPAYFRVPDLCLVRERPEGGIIVQPPAICIEILSPDDSAKELADKIAEYLQFGADAVWVMDPIERNGTVYPASGRPTKVEDGLFKTGEFEVNIRKL
jgi:Uma2 family endonuclease